MYPTILLNQCTSILCSPRIRLSMTHFTESSTLTVLHREWHQSHSLVPMNLCSVFEDIWTPDLTLAHHYSSECSASLIWRRFKACYASRVISVTGVTRTASRRSRRIRPSLRREQDNSSRFAYKAFVRGDIFELYHSDNTLYWASISSEIPFVA
jgi:hypothetical protein